MDLTAFLELDPRAPETDIEAAARVGNRAYWITSHGRNKNGKEREARHRFFATDLRTNEGSIQLVTIGKPYKNLLDDLIAAPQLKQFNLAIAATRAPKSAGGLAIEGLAALPDGGLLVGFRNAIPKGRALLVPMLNPDAVLRGERAKFGAPIQLDLGGLGIRDICCWQGEFIIIAGRYDSGGTAKLFRWPGGGASPVPMKHLSLKALNPEAIIVYADQGLRRFQLLSDDSREQKKGDAAEMSDRTHFRSVWVTP